jgi:hypothetical protein
MIKVQMMRAQTKSPHSLPYGIEERFVDGTIDHMPQLGRDLLFYYDRLGKGWMRTTTIKEIVPGPDLTIFRTENSEYHLKEGWRDED